MMNLKTFFEEDTAKVGDNNYSPSDLEFSVENDIEDDVETIESNKQASDKKQYVKIIKMANAGFSEKQIAKVLKLADCNALPESVKAYMKDVKGIVGVVCVDCGVFKDNLEYKKNAGKYKDFHKYAFNCKCDRHTETQASIGNGNMDSYLSAECDTVIDSGICDKTGLEVISSISEIKPEAVADVVYKIGSLGYYSKDEAKKILLSNNNISAIKKAFNIMEHPVVKKAEVEEVKNNFYIKKADMKVEIGREADKDIKVSPYSSNVKAVVGKEADKNIKVSPYSVSVKAEIGAEADKSASVAYNKSRMVAQVGKEGATSPSVAFSKSSLVAPIDKVFVAKNNVAFEKSKLSAPVDKEIIAKDIKVSPYGNDIKAEMDDETEDDIDVAISNELDKIYDDNSNDFISSTEDIEFNDLIDSDDSFDKTAMQESDIKINFDENEK